VTIREITLLLNAAPGSKPELRKRASEIRFIPCLCWRILRLRGVSSSLGQFPAIVRRNLKNLYACAPPAPTEASAIFTPGPMVEEMEIFFM
jgi:hypothetical protein